MKLGWDMITKKNLLNDKSFKQNFRKIGILGYIGVFKRSMRSDLLGKYFKNTIEKFTLSIKISQLIKYRVEKIYELNRVRTPYTKDLAFKGYTHAESRGV